MWMDEWMWSGSGKAHSTHRNTLKIKDFMKHAKNTMQIFPKKNKWPKAILWHPLLKATKFNVVLTMSPSPFSNDNSCLHRLPQLFHASPFHFLIQLSLPLYSTFEVTWQASWYDSNDFLIQNICDWAIVVSIGADRLWSYCRSWSLLGGWKLGEKENVVVDMWCRKWYCEVAYSSRPSVTYLKVPLVGRWLKRTKSIYVLNGTKKKVSSN